jgi:hypothetical protein
MIFKKLFGKPQAAHPDFGNGAELDIQSAAAGTLTRVESWRWRSQPIRIPYFKDLKMAVEFHDIEEGGADTFLAEYDAALLHFLKLNLEDRNSATPHVHAHCRDCISSADFEGREALASATVVPASVWPFVKPIDVTVSRRLFNEQDVYIAVSCAVPWEDEHGMQLVFRQGKQLTRVGPIDGHLTDADAHNIPDEQDAMLSAWRS